MRTSLTDLLRLDSPPVAISFVEEAPPGVPHVSSMEQAGCGYWRRAAAGEVFFTVADDHKRCPVGAHTHNVPLSPSEQQELMGLVGTMVAALGGVGRSPAFGQFRAQNPLCDSQMGNR